MSEYQYYEWQTVDRLLTAEERAAVDRLSSHINSSSSKAVVTYHWGDFKHNPKEVLLKYFYAHFYLANRGSLRLMFRFPGGIIDDADIEPYCVKKQISFETIGEYQVLEVDFTPEDSGSWMEADAGLAHFIRLRADILDGDYRLLYLAWLKAMTFSGVPCDALDDEDLPDSAACDIEPPIPPGLKNLSPALQNFVTVFGINPYLVQAAAEASPDPGKAWAAAYANLAGRLSRAECDEFLTRLAQGEAGVALMLRRRLASFLPQPAQPQAAQPRTIHQLRQRAERLNQAEQKRQAEATRQRHIVEMKTLAAQEEQTWRKVEDLLDNGRKIASVYDEATGLLEKLQQLSNFQDTARFFQQHLRRLARKYSARPALMNRWRTRGWI